MTDRPNIVLVTVDSLRADHCSFMGYERETTPNLDGMAEDGVVFENAIAPGPATPESMPAIFTGEYPLGGGTDSDAESALAARRERIRTHMQTRETLPERLRQLGYTTAAFTPNPFTSRHFGFDRGFDHFEDFMSESQRGGLYQRLFEGFLEGGAVSSMARVLSNFWQREEVFKPWESYAERAIEWTRGTEEPFFLWVFLMDAHNPYLAPGEYRSQAKWKEFHANFEFWRQSHETPFSEPVHERLVTAYDDAIRYSDAFLARLREGLGETDPVVAVHGDHGEAFGEHGTYGHEPYLYEENVRVPLVVDGVPSATLTRPFSLRDLPDLLTTVGTGNHDRLTAEFVRSRTDDGASLSLHTSSADVQYDAKTGAPVDDSRTAASELGRMLADQQTAHDQERRAVRDAATRLEDAT